jgi:hypothetical protein
MVSGSPAAVSGARAGGRDAIVPTLEPSHAMPKDADEYRHLN